MKNLINGAKKVLGDESGAATVEYGLITLGVVVAVTGAASSFKDQITALFTDVGTTLTAAQTTAKAAN